MSLPRVILTILLIVLGIILLGVAECSMKYAISHNYKIAPSLVFEIL